MTDQISITPDRLAVRLAHAFERERRTTTVTRTIDLNTGTASESGLEGGANVAAALEARLAALEEELARVQAALEAVEERTAQAAMAERANRRPRALTARLLRAE